MKKFYLLFSLGLMNFGFAQQFTPVFEKNFNTITSDANFTVGTTGVTQSTDYYYNELSAARFNGNTKGVQLDFSSQPTLETEGTVEFFYQHNSLETAAYGSVFPIFYMSHGAPFTSSRYSVLFAANSANVYTVSSTSQQLNITGPQSNTNYNSNPLIKDKWHHYIISYKFAETGGYVRVYQNGKFLVQVLQNFVNTNTPKIMHFLSHTNNTNNLLTTSTAGHLDDIKVYTESFTPAQVTERFMEVSKITKGTATAKYKFNNNLTDFFGGPNVTTFGNTPVYDQNLYGSSVSSLSVNPNTQNVSTTTFYGQVPQSLNAHLGTQYTVSFAYKSYTSKNDNSGSDVVPIVYIPTTDSTKPITIGVRKNSNTVPLPICVKLGANRYDSDVTINTGVWGHATVVVNNNYLSLYFNGERILNNINISANAKQPSSTSPILIGKSESPLDWFRGYIDDLVIDNKAYSPADARALYAQWINQQESFTTNTSLATSTSQNSATVMKIAPNPSLDFISILNVADVSNVKIFSSAGQLVTYTKNTKNIDVRNLSKGVYFISVQQGNGNIVTKQFIKK